MSFPRYPKYKASGVEWLGDVPEGWEVKPLRSVFKFSKGLTITKENLQDEGVNCVNYGEIHSKYGFRLNPEIHPLRCVAPEYLSTNPEALIRDGDFVFADTSEDLEGSGNFTHLRSDDPIFAGYHTIIARPRKGISPLLLAYQIHSSAFRSQIQKQVKGVKVFSISQGILKAAKCLLPPLPEQTAIAEFLDRETGKIDGLVAEQRRLMELLKEKRQAVISHAVTKGLNPHAPMKPSGIEWLGDVPDGWEVGKCGFYLTILSGFSFPSAGFSRDEHDTKLLRGINVGVSRLKWDETVYWRRSPGDGLDVYEMKEGDLVIGMDRPLIGEGMRVAKVKDYDLPCLLLQRVASLKMGRRLNSSYLFELISSEMFIAHFSPDTTGVSVPHISPEQICNFVIPLPPIAEQQAIVAFLDTELAKFDTLTAEAQRAIDLLQERRTALISAAVTGQIDVRGAGAAS
jgi:type I restriction enzyme S subunit